MNIFRIFASLWLLSVQLHAALSPLAQQDLARSMGQKVQRFEMTTDDSGNVTGLVFVNHGGFDLGAGLMKEYVLCWAGVALLSVNRRPENTEVPRIFNP